MPRGVLKLLLKLAPILCLFYLMQTGFLNFPHQMSVEAASEGSDQYMDGKVLRVLVFHFPPWMLVENQLDGTFSYKGSSFEMLDYIAKALKVKYEYVHLKSEDIKKYGIGPAQLRMITNGDVDLAPFGIVSSYERYLKVDFTIPFYMDPFRLIVPFPKSTENRIFAIIQPFQPLVWLGIASSIIVAAPVLVLLSDFYLRFIVPHSTNLARIHQPLFSFSSLLHFSSFLLANLANKTYKLRMIQQSLGSYVLVGVWCLAAVLLANAYTGTLFSFLSVEKYESIPNSLEELVTTTKLSLLLQDNSVLAHRFLDATKGTDKLIGDSLRANPENLFSDLQDVKKKLSTGKFALAYYYFIANAMMYATYKENNNQCIMTIAEQPIPVFLPVVAALEKGGPFTKAISQQIQAQFEVGIVDDNFKRTMMKIEKCKMTAIRQVGHHYKKLSLLSMSGAFCLLAIGHGLAFLAFLCELIYKRIKQHYFDENDEGRNQTNNVQTKPSLALEVIDAGSVAVFIVLINPPTAKPDEKENNSAAKMEMLVTVDLEEWSPIVVHSSNYQTIEIQPLTTSADTVIKSINLEVNNPSPAIRQVDK